MQANTGSNLSKALFYSTLFFIVACNSNPVPKGIIAINPMKELMWDIAQVEIYANQHLIKDSTKNIKAETLNLYQQVFAIHKTSKEQFAASIRYYEAHPVTHQILLDSLMQYANRERDTAIRKSFIKPAAVMK